MLKEARRAVGLTQREAAARIGVSLGTVSRWEQGRVTPSGRYLDKAAEVYEADFGLTADPASVRALEERIRTLEDKVIALTREVRRRPR
ncbi:MAG: helix-turn-helix domain-containing protein [Actinobacteria bacterium]|nr:helix-turn-helix domain-containing protein [Actinomycetota bacterium]